MKRPTLSFILAMLLSFHLNSLQASNGVISIDSCYIQAKLQFPLIKQKGLIEKTKAFNLENASKGYFPQFTINGQATYQSAVTEIPITIHLPGMNLSIPTLPKDQFNVHGDVTENIYDGGLIAEQKNAYDVSAQMQQQNLEVQLYALKDRINQVYFGILLMNEQLKQNALMAKDIQNSINKIQAGVLAGTALKTGLIQLQSKLIQEEQSRIELLSARKAYADMLGVFVNRDIDTSMQFEVPKCLQLIDSIKRPEINLYALQQKNDDVQLKSLLTGVRPKLSLFLQGGYALPGLNAFEVTAQPYYIGGARLSWNFGGYYTLNNQKKIISLDKEAIGLQKDVFMFNTRIALKQQSAEVQKYLQLIQRDQLVIQKLTEVKNNSRNQLDAGVLTVHEYISDLVAEDQAKQALLLHQVQLLLSQYSFQNTTGNL